MGPTPAQAGKLERSVNLGPAALVLRQERRRAGPGPCPHHRPRQLETWEKGVGVPGELGAKSGIHPSAAAGSWAAPTAARGAGPAPKAVAGLGAGDADAGQGPAVAARGVKSMSASPASAGGAVPGGAGVDDELRPGNALASRSRCATAWATAPTGAWATAPTYAAAKRTSAGSAVPSGSIARRILCGGGPSCGVKPKLWHHAP